MAAWQNKNNNWLEKNKFLFNNDVMSDCSFLIKLENIKIPAHKYILGGSSTVFYDYFYNMKADFNEITVDDISVENFLIFLKFLYTGRKQLNTRNINEILTLAVRYSVQNLKEVCREFLLNQLTKDNALKFLEKYSSYQLTNFEDGCLSCISSNPTIFQSPLFYEISIQTLKQILKSEDLRGFQEITIYNGVNNWAERACQKKKLLVNSVNKRNELGSAIDLIRFGTMTIQEFIACTVNQPILDPQEIESIFLYIGSDGNSSCKFSGKKRKPNKKVFKFSHLSPTVNYYGINAYELFNFTVSKPIQFYGILIYGRAKSSLKESTRSENFKIKLLNENKEIIHEYVYKIEHLGNDIPHGLYEHNSISLSANQKYIMYVEGEEKASKFMNYETSEKIIKRIENEVMFTIKDNNYVGAGIIYSV